MQRFLGWVHALIGWPIFCFWTVIAGVGIAAGRVLQPGDSVRRPAATALGTTWGRWMWWTQPFWQRAFIGLENLGEGPYVLVSNHQSAIDIPALYGLPIRMKVVTKTANFSIPVMGPFLAMSGQVGTDAFLEEAQRALDAGLSVLVFAEGGRSSDGQLKRFKRGAFELASRTGRPVVPIAIEGPTLIMAPRQFVPTQLGVPVVVSVGRPFQGTDPVELRDRAHGEVARMLAELRGRVRFRAG